ncbi:MAG TPA: type II toxin-antitoxin system RelE/ParE family toxin [Gallionellaceae bacterium]
MRYEVMLTEHALHDLEELYDYIAAHDEPASADHVLDSLEAVIDSLSDHPERGSYPKELINLGIREYRQVFFKPYRVIYRVIGKTVYIMLIADGRRDMETLLSQRMLTP